MFRCLRSDRPGLGKVPVFPILLHQTHLLTIWLVGMCVLCKTLECNVTVQLHSQGLRLFLFVFQLHHIKESKNLCVMNIISAQDSMMEGILLQCLDLILCSQRFVPRGE